MSESLKLYIQRNGTTEAVDVKDVYIHRKQVTGQVMLEVYHNDPPQSGYLPLKDFLLFDECPQCKGLMSYREPSDLNPECNNCWEEEQCRNN